MKYTYLLLSAVFIPLTNSFGKQFDPRFLNNAESIDSIKTTNKRQIAIPRLQLIIRPPYADYYTIGFKGSKNTSVCLGGALGVEYSVRQLHYYSFEAGFAAGPLSFKTYFPVNGYLPPLKESKVALFARIMNCNKIGNFNIGYGLSFGKRNWKQYYRLRPFSTSNNMDSIVTQRSFWATGLSLTVGYQISSATHAGISYQPHIIETETYRKFQYGYILSAGFYWKIRLIKHKKSES